jgi:hypothetical protein
VLHRLGYAADGLYIDLGIDAGIAYSSKSRGFCERFAEREGLTLRVVSVPETYGRSIATRSAAGANPARSAAWLSAIL